MKSYLGVSAPGRVSAPGGMSDSGPGGMYLSIHWGRPSQTSFAGGNDTVKRKFTFFYCRVIVKNSICHVM